MVLETINNLLVLLASFSMPGLCFFSPETRLLFVFWQMISLKLSFCEFPLKLW